MRIMVKSVDINNDGFISKEEFGQLVRSPEAMLTLHDLEVDVIALLDLTDFLFHESEEISLEEFQKVLLQLRGSSPATVKDVVDMRKFISAEIWESFNKMNQRLNGEPPLSRVTGW